jgi:hypothetical protein
MRMAHREKKAEAVRMRNEGASYTQIKERLGVGKSTLSLWLRGLPLSESRMRELRDFSQVRIEKYRETRRRTREARFAEVMSRASKDIGKLTRRELLIAGLFLYWGEGTKTAEATVSVSNTDPAMLRFFIAWLELLGVAKKRLKVKLHLYRDMDAEKEMNYWSKALGIPRPQFRKPYIKDSLRSGLSYPQRFTHGTGNIVFGNRDVAERVMQSLEYLRSQFAPE